MTEPLFNPTGGYASYVVPAAFILILQQTLLMGAASLGGIAFERGGRAARRVRGSVGAMFGQALAHLCLAAPGLALYLIILPRVYGFSTLGNPFELLLMAIPFVLAVSFLAQFVASGFKRRETAVLLFIATGLPLFFLVGVSWPLERIPDSLRLASRIFPSTSAIDGLRPHQPDGREPARRVARLADLVGIGGRLCAACGPGDAPLEPGRRA